jgi:hypothetical protein
MYVYDYKTKKEYRARSPRKNFYDYESIEIELCPGRRCSIMIKKGDSEGRKPLLVYEQLNLLR